MCKESIKLFISYSHKDDYYRERLYRHLTPLRRQDVVKEWHDRQIQAGKEWAGEIDENLNQASIILLLVSPDFVYSDYCTDIEVKRAIERHEKGEAVVIPIIIKPCYWRGLDFARFQSLPKDAEAISLWKDEDEAFLDAIAGIQTVAQELIEQRKRERHQKQVNQETYKNKVEEVLSINGEISIADRDTLDELRESLSLTKEESDKIEENAYKPYKDRAEKLERYKKTLLNYINNGKYPFSDEVERELENRQRDLGIKTEDIEEIEQPILEAAEAKYQEKLQVEALKGQQQQEYASKLRQYEKEFLKAVQAEYPLSQAVVYGIKNFQQQLELKREDAKRIEQPILKIAEAKSKYQQKLQAEALKRQQQQEYASKLRQYEKEFSKAVQAEYPLNQAVLAGIKNFQQQLELKREDAKRIEQPILNTAEAKYQKKLQVEALKRQQQQEYASKLRQYEKEFSKAVQAEYPLSQAVLAGIKNFQQQLELKREDANRIEQPILKIAEAKSKYQQKLQAEALKGQQPRQQEQNILPVFRNTILENIGVETASGFMTMLIPKGTSLPTQKKITLTTTVDSQTSIETKIFIGKSALTKYNKELGELSLDGIPSKPKGKSNLEIVFDVSQNGSFHVSAKVLGTNTPITANLNLSSSHSNDASGNTEFHQIKVNILNSERFVDYSKLRDLLEKQLWKEADQETTLALLKAASPADKGYFDEEAISAIPCRDLETVDLLWVKYSKGWFGFSIQKALFMTHLEDKGKFGEAIGWRGQSMWSMWKWRQYKELIFTAEAPAGQFPTLKNIDRGNKELNGMDDKFGGAGIDRFPFLFQKLIECET